MKYYLISDTHFKHEKMQTYCQRPADFTKVLLRNLCNTLSNNTCLIHLGDVGIGGVDAWRWILAKIPGRKILIRGNHDRQRSVSWWMENGFDFSCDGLKFRNMWLTHEPSTSLADGCELNIHGHLHNIWHGFHCRDTEGNKIEQGSQPPPRKLKHPWQRLFAVEYTNYHPVEFDKFVSHPDKYQARGPINAEG